MERAAIFVELDFDAAIEAARSRGVLLFVDATAVWCGPCQVMDRTTWVDQAVTERLRDKALVIQFDVDENPEIAARLRIKGMPSVVALRNGIEIDRVVGLQTPDALLGRFEGLEHGVTALDATRRGAASKPGDMQARMKLARQLLDAENFDEATSEYVWLWKNMLQHQPAMYGVRLSFLVGDLERLIASHPPAADAVRSLRDEVAPEADGDPDRERLRDWFALNKALGDEAVSLTWFDAVRGRLVLDDRLAGTLAITIGPLLMAAQRWADLAPLYPDPVAVLRREDDYRQRALQLPAHLVEQTKAYADQAMRARACQLVLALRAGGRADEARTVVDLARQLDPSEPMAKVLEHALKPD